MILEIITFIASIAIVLSIFIKWLFKVKYENTDFIVLIGAATLIVCLGIYKQRSEQCTNPCPKYEQINVPVYKLKN